MCLSGPQIDPEAEQTAERETTRCRGAEEISPGQHGSLSGWRFDPFPQNVGSGLLTDYIVLARRWLVQLHHFPSTRSGGLHRQLRTNDAARRKVRSSGPAHDRPLDSCDCLGWGAPSRKALRLASEVRSDFAFEVTSSARFGKWPWMAPRRRQPSISSYRRSEALFRMA